MLTRREYSLRRRALAAGVGFEPTRRLTASSGFQDRLVLLARCGFAGSVAHSVAHRRSSRLIGDQPVALCAVFSVSTRSQLFGALAVRANQRLDEPGTHVLSETSAARARPLNGRWLDPTDHVFSLGRRATPTREPLGEHFRRRSARSRSWATWAFNCRRMSSESVVCLTGRRFSTPTSTAPTCGASCSGEREARPSCGPVKPSLRRVSADSSGEREAVCKPAGFFRSRC